MRSTFPYGTPGVGDLLSNHREAVLIRTFIKWFITHRKYNSYIALNVSYKTTPIKLTFCLEDTYYNASTHVQRTNLFIRIGVTYLS